jgi:hypothetical protein
VKRAFVYGLPGGRNALVRGRLRDWFVSKGIPAQNVPRLKGWRVRVDRIGDVIALLEADGFRVQMKGELR